MKCRYRVQNKNNENHNNNIDKKRVTEPLDAARMILQHSLEKHSVVPKAVHVNCLAAGYQFVGLYSEAENVFEFLEGRGGGDVGDVGGRNHHDDHKNANANTSTHKMEEKNEGSYSILVKNAVTQGDWSSAIDNLREMTDRGHYPKARSLNAWSETANKRERRPRRTAWIKKRERMLMKSALYDGDGDGGSGGSGSKSTSGSESRGADAGTDTGTGEGGSASVSTSE